MNRIGVDIGGTQLRVAALDEEGSMLALPDGSLCRMAIPNDHSLGPEGNLTRLVDCIKGWGIDYAGIGIGCPGPLDFSSGTILTPPNLPGWEGFEVVHFFEEACGRPTFVNNDANVAGLAEAHKGAGFGYESVFYFTVSTGVGGAYIYRGEIVGGAHSCAAEVFDMMVNDYANVRPSMNVGSLEDQASGTAIGRIGSQELGQTVEAVDVFSLWMNGDAAAAKVINRAADALARAVNNVCCVVDPDVFVFGGSVSLHNPGFIDLVHKKAKGYVINPGELYFRLAECGGDAGLVGAALLVK
jgi:glucokinase